MDGFRLIHVAVGELCAGELFYLGRLMHPCVVASVGKRLVRVAHSYDMSYYFYLDPTQRVYVRATNLSNPLPL